jgi:hypothetical protein
VCVCARAPYQAQPLAVGIEALASQEALFGNPACNTHCIPRAGGSDVRVHTDIYTYIYMRSSVRTHMHTHIHTHTLPLSFTLWSRRACERVEIDAAVAAGKIVPSHQLHVRLLHQRWPKLAHPCASVHAHTRTHKRRAAHRCVCVHTATGASIYTTHGDTHTPCLRRHAHGGRASGVRLPR